MKRLYDTKRTSQWTTTQNIYSYIYVYKIGNLYILKRMRKRPFNLTHYFNRFFCLIFRVSVHFFFSLFSLTYWLLSLSRLIWINFIDFTQTIPALGPCGWFVFPYVEPKSVPGDYTIHTYGIYETFILIATSVDEHKKGIEQQQKTKEKLGRKVRIEKHAARRTIHNPNISRDNLEYR